MVTITPFIRGRGSSPYYVIKINTLITSANSSISKLMLPSLRESFCHLRNSFITRKFNYCPVKSHQKSTILVITKISTCVISDQESFDDLLVLKKCRDSSLIVQPLDQRKLHDSVRRQK